MSPRCAALIVAAALALGACQEDGVGAADTVDVVVRLDPDGLGGLPAREADVRCTDRLTAACRALLAAPASTFRPVPPDRVCTLLFGGPQRARVTGLVSGQRVTAAFSRENGCQIARWKRLEPVWRALRNGG